MLRLTPYLKMPDLTADVLIAVMSTSSNGVILVDCGDIGVQRLTCHKTFNAVTGTSLARLHHRNKWFDYLRCMRDSLTLRVSAFRVGIDLNRKIHKKGEPYSTH
tara:strand:+ start:24335 stop:24646 length:312 start_codon:yes stop_codon:yes gene_type:complete